MPKTGNDQTDTKDPEPSGIEIFNLSFEMQERPITHSDVESLLNEFVGKLGRQADSPAESRTQPEADHPSLYSLIEKILSTSGTVPKEIIDQLLTYEDVAARWQVSERYVKKIKARGHLRPAPLQGRMIRFSEEELQRYLSEDGPRRTRRKRP